MATEREPGTSGKKNAAAAAAAASSSTAVAPPAAPASAAPPAGAGGANARVKWNVEQLKSSYVNFANANSTREEVVLNFGLNKSWDRAQPEVEIELLHRVVMSPFAAKRLGELVSKLLAEYEARYGELK